MVSWLHHQGLAFVSCVSTTFFQPAWSGSHLYPAHRNTVRSGHRVEGLTDSRGSFPLGLPCPRLLYPYCITTWGVCQEVFEISFKGLFLLGAPLTLGVLWTLLDFSYIVSHIGRFVKRVFEKNRNFFSKGCSLHSMGMVATHRLFGFVSQRGRLNSSGALPS